MKFIKSQEWVWPRWSDPRYLILIFFAIMTVTILSTPGFARTPFQFATACLTCFALDLVLGRLLSGKMIFPLSGVVSSFGISVLIDSPLLWPTALAAVLSTLSKQLIRFEGRHVFNPNNFGVVLVTLAFPDWATTAAMRWGGRFDLSVLLLAVGTMIVVRANRWAVSFAYIGSFLFFNVLRSLIFAKPLWVYSVSLLGPAMQLFIFYMISDPKTTPLSRRGQVLFGVGLGLLDNVFRHMQFKDAPLYALFVGCALYSLMLSRRSAPAMA